ncbi:MAG: YbaK/EbsC family protein [Spirochaetes bacterium]|nr:YbaK/EbsC family protein [Spirochaetota bacterium]
MPEKNLRRFLDEKKIKYVTISHSLAYTAQEIAASAHIHGKQLAKTVIVRIGPTLAMAVLPANFKVDLKKLGRACGAAGIDLAEEEEFVDRIGGCALGAMPPFGNLFGMEVWVDRTLTEDEEIVFNAGSHTELIQLAYKDFERLVSPRVADFAVT